MSKRFQSFAEFWPFYLSEHRNTTSRRLHLVGSTLVIAWLIVNALSGHAARMPWALLIGYGFAWVGHFHFEKNKPATFQYPLWSFLSDFKMLGLFYLGKLPAEFKKYAL